MLKHIQEVFAPTTHLIHTHREHIMDTDALRDTWLMFQRDHGCSIDRMLCRPSLREEFLSAARLATAIGDEETLLWGLVTLRKRKSLPSVLK